MRTYARQTYYLRQCSTRTYAVRRAPFRFVSACDNPVISKGMNHSEKKLFSRLLSCSVRDVSCYTGDITLTIESKSSIEKVQLQQTQTTHHNLRR